MSGMLENLVNPASRDVLEERMAQIKEDPSLKPILEEIETGGPAAMMRSDFKFCFVISYCSPSLLVLLPFVFPLLSVLASFCT